MKKKDKPEMDNGLDFEQGCVPLDGTTPVFVCECGAQYPTRPYSCSLCGKCLKPGAG